MNKVVNKSGYMQDASGRLIPESKVRQIDKDRDSLVRAIVHRAKTHSIILHKFKTETMKEIDSFAKKSSREYKVHLGGKKGNITLLSYDGQFKIIRAINENLVFDERLQIARALIGECIKEWVKGSKAEIKVLIEDAFTVNKQGKLDRNRILGLRRLKINDPKWRKAMDAISESLQVIGSKEYIRMYERQPDGSFQQINLDVSAV